MKPTNLSLAEILKALENFDLDAAPSFGGPSELNSAYTFSRARAIEDGELIDVTKQAKELGIRFPTALSARLWAEAVAVSFESDEDSTKAEELRVKALLEQAVGQLESKQNKCDRFKYLSTRLIGISRELDLMAAISPGDDGREVLTVMFPNED